MIYLSGIDDQPSRRIPCALRHHQSSHAARRSSAFCWSLVARIGTTSSRAESRAVVTVFRASVTVGEKDLRAVHREAIRRRAMGLFGDGRGRSLRLPDDVGSEGFGGRLVIFVEHPGEALAVMPVPFYASERKYRAPSRRQYEVSNSVLRPLER